MRRSIAALFLVTFAAAGACPAAPATATPPVLDLRLPTAGELHLGDSAARVRRLWGEPLSVVTAGRRTTLTFGFEHGRLVVHLEAGRVRMVVVRERIRTTKGDERGTTLATFRTRWRGTVHRNCCAVGIRHVRVPTRTAGRVFVATFRDGRLTELSLTSESTFRRCFVAECD